MFTYCPKNSWYAKSHHGSFMSLGSFGVDNKLGHSVAPASISLQQTFLLHEITTNDCSVEIQLKETASTQGCGAPTCCHLSTM